MALGDIVTFQSLDGSTDVFRIASDGTIILTGIEFGNATTPLAASFRLADSQSIALGAGGDLTLTHGGTDSTITSATGDLTIDNTAATGSTILQLGTDTLATSVEMKDNTGTIHWEFLGDGQVNDYSFRQQITVFDDFNSQLTEAASPWILNSGADAQAIDPAIVAAENGIIRLVTGDADGTVANDGSQFVMAMPVQTDSGGFVAECRIRIATAITAVSVNFGLTDSQSLEEPFTIATATVTSTATDAACFTFDDGATAKEWHGLAVDTDTEDTGNASLSIGPVADTFQTLAMVVSNDGADVHFYVDGVLALSLTGAAGCGADVALYATVIANATTTTSKTVDVDWIGAWTVRG